MMKPEVSEINLERRTFMKSLPGYLLDSMQHALRKAIVIPAEAGIHKLNGPPLSRGRQTDRDDFNSTRPMVARVNVERCLAWGNALCQACYLACPLRDRAIEIIDQKPIINMSVCDGCALCVSACRTVNDQVAIELKSLTKSFSREGGE